MKIRRLKTLTYSYIAILLLIAILPINDSKSILNNNYILEIRLDYIGHFIIFGILGWLGMTYWKLTKRNIFIPLILLLSLAFGLEIIQYFIPWRAFNVNDMVANEVGVTCGTFCFIIFKKISYFNLTPKDNL